MRSTWRVVWFGLTLIGAAATLGGLSAKAQMPSSVEGRSLGGYGGSITETGSDMGMSGPVIPYGGMFGGFMPYRMGGGSSLSFPTRGSSTPGSGRRSFSLSPMSGGMGGGFGAGSRMSSSFGSRTATGLDGMQSMPGTRRMGVMPPSFGSPFRQPPSLLSPSSGGAGMSM